MVMPPHLALAGGYLLKGFVHRHRTVLDHVHDCHPVLIRHLVHVSLRRGELRPSGGRGCAKLRASKTPHQTLTTCTACRGVAGCGFDHTMSAAEDPATTVPGSSSSSYHTHTGGYVRPPSVVNIRHHKTHLTTIRIGQPPKTMSWNRPSVRHQLLPTRCWHVVPPSKVIFGKVAGNFA